MEFEYFEENGIDYVKEIYSDGSSIIYPRPSEEPEPKDTMPIVEETISLEERLKNLEQGQIVTQEAIATMYEDSTKRNIQVDETLATIYEALTDKG